MTPPQKSEKFETESPELRAKLKACDPEIQDYLVALKKEIAKLQRKNISVEAQNVVLYERVKIFEEEDFYCPECERRLIKEAEEK